MDKQAEQKTAGGKTLKCLVCCNDTFFERPAQLNTRMMTFFNLDWANKTAICRVCESCGFIHWFLPRQ